MNDPLKLDQQLCFPLYAASRKVISFYGPLLKPLGITYTQYLVMMVLWEKDGIPVREICERLYLDTGTLTPLLKKLEKEGLLVRTRSTEDERSVLIALTEDGRKLKEKAKTIPQQAGSCLSLSPGQASSLYQVLYEILNGPQ